MRTTPLAAATMALALAAAPALAQDTQDEGALNLLPDEVFEDAERAMEGETDVLVEDEPIGDGETAEIFEGDGPGLGIDEPDAENLEPGTEMRPLPEAEEAYGDTN